MSDTAAVIRDIQVLISSNKALEEDLIRYIGLYNVAKREAEELRARLHKLALKIAEAD